MNWPEVTVTVAGIAGAVALLWRALPYFVARGEEQRKAAALVDINRRLDLVESKLAGPRLPIGLPGRRSA